MKRLFWLLIATLLVATLALGISAEEYHIPSGYREYNGHLYMVFDEYMTWENANEYCKSLGGHLVTITSQEEQELVASLVNSKERNIYFMGGTDMESEGVWKWVTGEEWTYSNWKTSEPDNWNGKSHSLTMFSNKVQDNSWVKNAKNKWGDFTNTGYISSDMSGYWGSKSQFGFICEWEGACVSSNNTYSSNHSFTDNAIVTEPDCITDGQIKRVCERCLKEEVTVKEKLGHTFSQWSKSKEPSCTVKGEEIRQCERCSLVEKKEAELLSHQMGEFVVISGSKLIPPIVKERTCTVCGYIESHKDWSYIWVTILAGLGAIGVGIGLVNYFKMLKRSNKRD